MSKNLTYISLALAICAFVFSVSMNRKISDLKSQVSVLREELTQKSEATPSADTAKTIQASASSEYSPDSYNIQIVQLGGSGSMIDQVWTGVEGAYLNPSEDWSSVVFNSNASAVWVGCKKGYQAKACTLNKKSINDIHKDLGCFVGLQNTPLRNDISVTCGK